MVVVENKQRFPLCNIVSSVRGLFDADLDQSTYVIILTFKSKKKTIITIALVWGGESKGIE